MANDDEDSQRRWDHVRQPLSSREVQTRSLVDMHYQQQLNGNFPLSSPNPLDFSTEVGNKIFSPLFIAKVCVAVVHDTRLLLALRHGSLAACSPCLQGEKNGGSVRKDAP